MRRVSVAGTLAGIVPASFFLAHLGAEAATGDLSRVTGAVLGLGLMTGLPLLWFAIRRRTTTERSLGQSGGQVSGMNRKARIKDPIPKLSEVRNANDYRSAAGG